MQIYDKNTKRKEKPSGKTAAVRSIALEGEKTCERFECEDLNALRSNFRKVNNVCSISFFVTYLRTV